MAKSVPRKKMEDIRQRESSNCLGEGKALSGFVKILKVTLGCYV